MIFHIPHASTNIPVEHRDQFLLTGRELHQEILQMTDHFTDQLFGECVGQDDAAVISPVSRLVVDMERFDDDSLESMAGVGMGVIYESTSSLGVLREKPTSSQREQLLRQYYRPHHKALERAVDAELDKGGSAMILDCHSFPSAPLPYERDRGNDRPDFCIGLDEFHTDPDLADLLISFFRSQGYAVKLNSPFSGTMVSSKHYLSDERVRSLMIEVNRALYMNESSGQKVSRFVELQGLMGEVVDSIKEFNRSG